MYNSPRSASNAAGGNHGITGGVCDQADGGSLVMVLGLSMGGSGGKATLTRRGVNSGLFGSASASQNDGKITAPLDGAMFWHTII